MQSILKLIIFLKMVPQCHLSIIEEIYFMVLENKVFCYNLLLSIVYAQENQNVEKIKYNDESFIFSNLF